MQLHAHITFLLELQMLTSVAAQLQPLVERHLRGGKSGFVSYGASHDSTSAAVGTAGHPISESVFQRTHVVVQVVVVQGDPPYFEYVTL
jgi:hypothetical protein